MGWKQTLGSRLTTAMAILSYDALVTATLNSGWVGEEGLI